VGSAITEADAAELSARLNAGWLSPTIGDDDSARGGFFSELATVHERTVTPGGGTSSLRLAAGPLASEHAMRIARNVALAKAIRVLKGRGKSL
jgi:hypothetical protein